MCTTKKASSPNPHRRNARERSLASLCILEGNRVSFHPPDIEATNYSFHARHTDHCGEGNAYSQASPLCTAPTFWTVLGHASLLEICCACGKWRHHITPGDQLPSDAKLPSGGKLLSGGELPSTRVPACFRALVFGACKQSSARRGQSVHTTMCGVHHTKTLPVHSCDVDLGTRPSLWCTSQRDLSPDFCQKFMDKVGDVHCSWPQAVFRRMPSDVQSGGDRGRGPQTLAAPGSRPSDIGGFRG